MVTKKAMLNVYLLQKLLVCRPVKRKVQYNVNVAHNVKQADPARKVVLKARLQ